MSENRTRRRVSSRQRQKRESLEATSENRTAVREALARNMNSAAGVAMRMTVDEMQGKERSASMRDEFMRWTPEERRRVRRELREAMRILDELCWRDDAPEGVLRTGNADERTAGLTEEP